MIIPHLTVPSSGGFACALWPKPGWVVGVVVAACGPLVVVVVVRSRRGRLVWARGRRGRGGALLGLVLAPRGTLGPHPAGAVLYCSCAPVGRAQASL